MTSRVPGDVLELLDVLEDLDGELAGQSRAVRELCLWSARRQDRITYRPAWQDVPVAHRLLGESTSLLVGVDADLEWHATAALVALLRATVLVADRAQNNEPVTRDQAAAIADAVEAPLAELAEEIRALAPEELHRVNSPAASGERPGEQSLGRMDRDGGSLITFVCQRARDAVDTVLAEHDDNHGRSLPELVAQPSPAIENLVDHLRGLASTLLDVVRPWRSAV